MYLLQLGGFELDLLVSTFLLRRLEDVTRGVLVNNTLFYRQILFADNLAVRLCTWNQKFARFPLEIFHGDRTFKFP